MTLASRIEKRFTEYSFQLNGIEGIIEVEIGTRSCKETNGHYYILIRECPENDVIARFSSGRYCGGTIEEKVVEALKKEPQSSFINGDYSRLQTCLRNIIYPTPKKSDGRGKKHANYGTIAAGIGVGR
jgi:hypothetical protein